MKNIFLAGALAALFIAQPALAGSLSDPVVTADVVAADASASSDETIDIVVLTITNVLLLMMAGGAF